MVPQQNVVRQLLPFQFGIKNFCFLCQGDGIQMKVAVEDDRAAGESSSKSAGKATQKHILTCNTKTRNILNSVHTVKSCRELKDAIAAQSDSPVR